MIKHNKYSNPSSSRASSYRKGTRVLLVCVYDTVIVQLTNDMVYETFSKHGFIEKILIFQKSEVTKCFVQFSKEVDTAIIRKTLDGTKIVNTFCKMHIFFSNLPEVDLKNKNSRGKDYSSISSHTTNHNTTPSPKKVTNRKSSDDFDIQMNEQAQPLSFAAYKSKTAGYELAKAIADFQKEQNYSEEESKLDQKIRWDIENIIEEKEEVDNVDHYNPIHSNRQIQFNTSNVLFFSFDNKISPMETYNVFSNYGNIEKIVCRNKVMFIEFSTVEYAVISKEYLNNTVLFGNLLKLYFGNVMQMLEVPHQYCESITFDQSFFRFDTFDSLTINPPGRLLHLTNIKKELFNADRIKQLIEQVARVEKITLNPDRTFATVKVSSIDDSLKVLACLHNKSWQSRKLQISFCKAKYC